VSNGNDLLCQKWKGGCLIFDVELTISDRGLEYSAHLLHEGNSADQRPCRGRIPRDLLVHVTKSRESSFFSLCHLVNFQFMKGPRHGVGFIDMHGVCLDVVYRKI
jgi:hypothetical protein